MNKKERKETEVEMVLNHRVQMLDGRVQFLEDRVNCLENIISEMNDMIKELKEKDQIGQIVDEGHQNEYDFDEIRTGMIVNDTHLEQVLETSMEEQIICIILEQNKKTPFMKMMKHLCMYKDKWVYMDDSDLKLLIETIEHKILLCHSKHSHENAEKNFENNKIIYGLNLSVRFKKIKNKLIDNI